MTGNMMIAIERVLKNEDPDMLRVYGDTNSTLAAALAATKLHIPICHVEAGTRTHCDTNPEEINRICTDHVSKILMCCTQSSMKELEHERLISKAYRVGDPMYDAFEKYSRIMDVCDIKLNLLDGGQAQVPDSYYYLTCHREENTTNEEALLEIFKAMDSLDAPVINLFIRGIKNVHCACRIRIILKISYCQNRLAIWRVPRWYRKQRKLLLIPEDYRERHFLQVSSV